MSTSRRHLGTANDPPYQRTRDAGKGPPQQPQRETTRMAFNLDNGHVQLARPEQPKTQLPGDRSCLVDQVDDLGQEHGPTSTPNFHQFRRRSTSRDQGQAVTQGRSNNTVQMPCVAKVRGLRGAGKRVREQRVRRACINYPGIIVDNEFSTLSLGRDDRFATSR